ANSYTGGTLIDAGTLSIVSDANLGDAAGAVTINTGTLATTADLVTSRAITLGGAGTLLTDAGTGFTVTSVIDGAGSLTNAVAGALVLPGAKTCAGGTTSGAGTLHIGNSDTGSCIKLEGADHGSVGVVRSYANAQADVMSGRGALANRGGETTF